MIETHQAQTRRPQPDSYESPVVPQDESHTEEYRLKAMNKAEISSPPVTQRLRAVRVLVSRRTGVPSDGHANRFGHSFDRGLLTGP